MLLPMQVGADLVRLARADGMAQSTTPLEDSSTLGSVTWNIISAFAALPSSDKYERTLRVGHCDSL